jgi:HAD superfamily hydrolase (TIGR01509 family)
MVDDMDLPGLVEAVVFDCDGLLVDTESGWSRAEAAIFAEHGFGFGPEQKALLIGKTLDDGAAAMASYFGRPEDAAAVAHRLHELVARELAAGANALPGAPELVAALKERVPVAVASNSPREFVDAALASAGLEFVFRDVLAAEDVARPKPAPDLYLAACARLGVSPEKCVAFEDSHTGVASARAAGMVVIGVPSLAGVTLDVDAVFGSLADPVLVGWAGRVRT